MNEVEKKLYFVGIGGSNVDGVMISRVLATENEIKTYLMSLIDWERQNNCGCWDSGTETDGELESLYSPNREVIGYYGYGNYCSWHTDYVAMEEERLNPIPVSSLIPAVENHQWW